VRYGYHRFGPLVDKTSTKPPVVFVPGFGTVMYIWPIPVSTFVTKVPVLCL
jgi:hypothetical protein